MLLVRKNTFKSVLALASEIALGAHTSSAILARIDRTFIHVDLQELICRFFYNPNFIVSPRMSDLRSYLAIRTHVTAFTHALVRYGMLPCLAFSLVQARRGAARILKSLTFRS